MIQESDDAADSRLRAAKSAGWGRLLPYGLRVRLSLPFVISTVLVLVLLAFFLGNRARDIYMDRLEGELFTQATLLADDAGRGMTGTNADDAVIAIVHDLGGVISSRLTIIDASGRVIADSEADPATMQNHNTRPEVIGARATGQGEAERRSATVDRDFLYLAVPIKQVPGAVARVAVPLQDVDLVVARIQRYIAVAATIAILIAIPMSLFMADRIVRPLDELREQAIAVAGGDRMARVKPDPTKEIGDLGRAFNSMTSELQTSLDTVERTGLRLEAVLAGLADGVILTDVDGRVVRMNQAA